MAGDPSYACRQEFLMPIGVCLPLPAAPFSNGGKDRRHPVSQEIDEALDSGSSPE